MAIDTMTAYERALIRSAMLEAQSYWLDEGAAERRRNSITGGVIAAVISDAFAAEAEKYKEPRTKETNDEVPGGFIGRDDDGPASTSLPEAG